MPTYSIKEFAGNPEYSFDAFAILVKKIPELIDITPFPEHILLQSWRRDPNFNTSLTPLAQWDKACGKGRDTQGYSRTNPVDFNSPVYIILYAQGIRGITLSDGICTLKIAAQVYVLMCLLRYAAASGLFYIEKHASLDGKKTAHIGTFTIDFETPEFDTPHPEQAYKDLACELTMWLTHERNNARKAAPHVPRDEYPEVIRLLFKNTHRADLIIPRNAKWSEDWYRSNGHK